MTTNFSSVFYLFAQKINKLKIMTADQIFFTILWIVGIPLGLIILRYEERKSYKDWLEREEDYLNKLK